MNGGAPPTNGGGGMDPRMAQLIMALIHQHVQARGLPHFAQGGVVTQPTVGLLGERGPEAVVPLMGAGGMQAQAAASPFGMQQAAPQLPNSPVSGWLGRQVQSGAGGTPQASFDPNNPFAGSYTRPLNTSEDIMGYLLRQGAQGGMFGQQGDPRITAMLRQQAIADAGAQGRSARLGLLGRSDVDPSTYGFQNLMSGLQGQGQVANAVNQAQLQQSLGAQDWYRNLFSGSAGNTQNYQNQRNLAQQQAGFRPPKNLLGDIAGSAGTAAGALF